MSNGRWSSRMCHSAPPGQDVRHAIDERCSMVFSGFSAPARLARDLPERFGPWQTVYDHFRKWRKSGVFARIIEALQIKLDQQGLIDWELWCVDGANVRAARAAAGADKKVSSDTRMNPKTTLWAAAEAGLEPSSTWLLTARELR